jgi:Type IV secretion system pilin
MINKLKLLLIALSVFGLGSILSAQTVSAAQVFQVCDSASAGTSSVCTDVKNQGSTDPVITILKDVINVVSIALGAAAVIMIMIGGLRFITGGSDPHTVSSARNMIIYALVGIVVAFLAQGIVLFVLDRVS